LDFEPFENDKTSIILNEDLDIELLNKKIEDFQENLDLNFM
jgi:hypothetical protein